MVTRCAQVQLAAQPSVKDQASEFHFQSHSYNEIKPQHFTGLWAAHFLDLLA